jgi:hypothetical protein
MRAFRIHNHRNYLVVFILIYALVQIPPYFLPVGVLDEGMYFNKFLAGSKLIANSGILNYVFSETNQLGLGSAYWIIGSCISYLTQNNIYLTFSVCRVITFASLLLIPLTIFCFFSRRHRNPENSIFIFTFLIIALWMSQGIAWWYGKLIGPDISTMAISFIASSLILINLDINFDSTFEVIEDRYFDKKRFLIVVISSIFLGLSLGIRLTVLPVILFLITLLSLNILNIKNAFYKITAIVFSILIGFIAANPFIGVNNINRSLKYFIENISSVNTSGGQFNFEKFKYILSNSSWTWDAIPLGGFFQVSLSFLSTSIIFFLLIKFYRKSVFISLIFSLVFAIFLFLKASIFYSWYLFPSSNLVIISLLSYHFGLAKFPDQLTSLELSKSSNLNTDNKKERIPRNLYILIALAIGLNIILNFSYIRESYLNKVFHYKALSSLKSGETQACIFNSESIEKIDINSLDLVVNLAELSLFEFPRGKSYLESYEAWRFINQPQFTSEKLLSINREIKDAIVVLGKRLLPKPNNNELRGCFKRGRGVINYAKRLSIIRIMAI